MFFTVYQTAKDLAYTKLKAYADDNFNVAQMWRFFFDGTENVLGQGEKADHHMFVLFL